MKFEKCNQCKHIVRLLAVGAGIRCAVNTEEKHPKTPKMINKVEEKDCKFEPNSSQAE